MTGGWQGNEGNYGGGWNPQQGGYPQQPPQQPDPYAGQYGVGPQGHGPQGTGPQGTQMYPVYDYGAQSQQPGGYPAPAFPQSPLGPEPPKRSKLPIIISLVAIVVAVAAVVTIVLLNRKGNDTADGGGVGNPQTTTQPKQSSKPSTPPSSSRRSTTAQHPVDPSGWQTITNTHVTYKVPANWKPNSGQTLTELGVSFAGYAESGAYDCGGKHYSRVFAASGAASSSTKTGFTLLDQAAADFGKQFGTDFYGGSTVDVPATKHTSVGGHDAVTVTAKVTRTPTDAACEASTGEVVLVLVLLDVRDGAQNFAVAAVVNDTAGGPASPALVPDSIAQQIIGTVSVH